MPSWRRSQDDEARAATTKLEYDLMMKYATRYICLKAHTRRFSSAERLCDSSTMLYSRCVYTRYPSIFYNHPAQLLEVMRSKEIRYRGKHMKVTIRASNAKNTRITRSYKSFNSCKLQSHALYQCLSFIIKSLSWCYTTMRSSPSLLDRGGRKTNTQRISLI